MEYNKDRVKRGLEKESRRAREHDKEKEYERKRSPMQECVEEEKKRRREYIFVP